MLSSSLLLRLSDSSEAAVEQAVQCSSAFDTRGGVLLYLFCVALLINALLLLCSGPFEAALLRLVEVLGISRAAAGSTLTAIGTSSPELFVSLVAAVQGGSSDSVGVSALVGSAVFNLAVIVGGSSFLSWLHTARSRRGAVRSSSFGDVVAEVVEPSKALEKRSILRDIACNAICFVFVIAAFSDGKLDWYESLLAIVLYALYFVFVLKQDALYAALYDRFHWSFLAFQAEDDVQDVEYMRVQDRMEAELLDSEELEYGAFSGGSASEAEDDAALGSGGLVHYANDDADEEQEREAAGGVQRVGATSDGELSGDGGEDAPNSSDFVATPDDASRDFFLWKTLRLGGLSVPIYRSQKPVLERPSAWYEWVSVGLGLPFIFLYHFLCPAAKNPTFGRAAPWVTFMVCLGFVGVETYFMTLVVEKIGCIIHADPGLMGGVPLAITTSLPDAMTSFALIWTSGRNSNMAFCNALGSNVFDLLLALGLPTLIASIGGQGITIAPGEDFFYSTAFIVVLALLLAATILSKWKIASWWLSGTLLSSYVVYVVCAAIFEQVIGTS